jgi:hypothetical protein
MPFKASRHSRLWLQAAVRTIVWLRPNHPQELTFATERPLSPIFVCSIPGSSPLGNCAKWAAVDPQRKSASLLLGPNRAYILPVSWPIQPGEVLVRHIAGG